jgi:hypothetical protein
LLFLRHLDSLSRRLGDYTKKLFFKYLRAHVK